LLRNFYALIKIDEYKLFVKEGRRRHNPNWKYAKVGNHTSRYRRPSDCSKHIFGAEDLLPFDNINKNNRWNTVPKKLLDMGLVESTTNKNERAFKTKTRNVILTAPLENRRNRTLSVHGHSSEKRTLRRKKYNHQPNLIEVDLMPSCEKYIDLDDKLHPKSVKNCLTLDTFIEFELSKINNHTGEWLVLNPIEDKPEGMCRLM
jgi:hypothetical protein